MRSVLLWIVFLLPFTTFADTIFSYDGFFNRMKKVQKAGYHDITLTFALLRQGNAELPCQLIQLYLISDIHHQAVSIADNGELNLPYDETLKDSKAKLVIEQADNVLPCELQFRIRSRMPLTATLSLSELQHYQQQFKALMKDLSGISYRWLPPVTGISAKFAAEAELLQGNTEVISCQQQDCTLYLDKLAVAGENMNWVFRQAPLYLYPYIDTP